LHLDATILLEAPLPVIAARLQDRDGVIRREDDIEAFMSAEQQQAKVVCSALGLRLVTLNSPTEAEFRAATLKG
jgi:hypothetical protein